MISNKSYISNEWNLNLYHLIIDKIQINFRQKLNLLGHNSFQPKSHLPFLSCFQYWKIVFIGLKIEKEIHNVNVNYVFGKGEIEISLHKQSFIKFCHSCWFTIFFIYHRCTHNKTFHWIKIVEWQSLSGWEPR